MHKQIGAKLFYFRLSAPNAPPPGEKLNFKENPRELDMF
jgi:hypothetical protein